jgi:hypothetical protein
MFFNFIDHQQRYSPTAYYKIRKESKLKKTTKIIRTVLRIKQKRTSLIIFLTLRHSVFWQPKSMRPLFQQSQPDPITEYNTTILAVKTKQVAIKKIK